ncbi:class I SAM-dependent methyltransferase [Vibrio sp. IB15]|uniref:Class I SAM-dependent methyltransferase n=1 Tax=Vibrio chagasii TaxID=170679 RepID=A0A7V7NWJ2_9VIBR|nr:MULTISPECIES: class I SAM-dependent methyltransferase [Vibrio]KAB0481944.1 class I SAM-dependent methyltransferase [Vibrio chagasii]MBJ2146154.1 class I SAM-dependent methyltransferase [Vibrio sp. IB15]
MPKISTGIINHNSLVWDKFALAEADWSKPVSQEVIEQAKLGNWSVHITKQPLTESWLPKCIEGKKILCLASAGGQQAPVLAAAGAIVTVYDLSREQLNKDKFVAKRDELNITTIQGDMRNLSIFEEQTFDFIISPISNLYIPDLKDLWNECYRVLKTKGILLTSFYNPVLFIFERNKKLEEQGLIKPKYAIPYSDKTSLTQNEYEEKLSTGQAIVFGHTLTEQIGEQINSGFVIAGFYEDEHPTPRFIIENYLPTMIATKAIKL